jgi:hypothetical protein
MIVFESKSAISNRLLEGTHAYKGLTYECRSYHFFADNGLHSQVSFQSMCPSLSRAHRQEHAIRCQRKMSMTDISRLRSDTNCQGANIIQKRQLWHRPQKCCIRTRLNNHRFVPDLISMGAVWPKFCKFSALL